MRINLSKATSAAKFLFNRACGVKYGGVKFGDGTFKLVKTDKLRKLNLRIEERVWTDYAKKLGRNDVKSVIRMAKPIHGSNVATTDNITY